LRQHSESPPDPLVERLAEDHGTDLLRYISRRVRTSADARDIAQEAYVRLLRTERKHLIRDPMAYLYRIAANVLYEFALKRREDLSGLMRWSYEYRSHHSHDAPETGGEAESLALKERLESVLCRMADTLAGTRSGIPRSLDAVVDDRDGGLARISS
jgi:DNA-directed RNA polymerase specialized sigma24 family protein